MQYIPLPERVALAHAPTSLRRWFFALVLGLMTVLCGCAGGDTLLPPAGLAYAMNEAVYEVGQEIPPNRPSVSGDRVDRYEVAPPLPAGLQLDATTGVISGTPTAASPATVHVVTATNVAGTATARVQIEVRDALMPPAGLVYGQATAVYTVGQAIVPNTPTSTGGPIASYTVAPALPAGLALDARTGEITGTPTAVSASAAYTVTGSNAAGSATATLQLTVQAALVAPASLAYDTADALYVTGEAITPNMAQVTGGPATGFSVTPALPDGLSLNASTGAITGTPAAVQAQAAYTVTASNAAGSASTQLRLAITSRGSWTSAAAILPGRHYFTLTKLLDGRVLAVGGFTDTGASFSARIYDPAADAWTAAAPALYARSGHTATLLADGRVLVAGGEDNFVGTATAELYDPVANTWTATGAMSVSRSNHTATLLPDGHVLVAGGYEASGGLSFRNTAERYDPATGTWTVLATPLAFARAQHAAELLPDGQTLLLAAGVNSSGLLGTAELFRVDDGGPGTTMPAAGGSGNVAQSVRLADGSVLVTTEGMTAWRFHSATSTWTTSAVRESRMMATLTRLADGRVLRAGGSSLATAEIYNPDVNIWTAAATMPTQRRAGAAMLLDDGSVLAVGGFATGEVSAVDRFRP